ncbi:hypothetical protein Bpfe_020892, partial [Biomphalaria pfeifferi]
PVAATHTDNIWFLFSPGLTVIHLNSWTVPGGRSTSLRPVAVEHLVQLFYIWNQLLASIAVFLKSIRLYKP